MRPVFGAAEFEIVGVRFLLLLYGRIGLDGVSDALALRIALGVFTAGKFQFYLRGRVTGRCPAHQRISDAGAGLFKLQHPILRFALAGLHGAAGWFVDTCGHGEVSVFCYFGKLAK
jgi:hypothetical protein